MASPRILTDADIERMDGPKVLTDADIEQHEAGKPSEHPILEGAASLGSGFLQGVNPFHGMLDTLHALAKDPVGTVKSGALEILAHPYMAMGRAWDAAKEGKAEEAAAHLQAAFQPPQLEEAMVKGATPGQRLEGVGQGLGIGAGALLGAKLSPKVVPIVRAAKDAVGPETIGAVVGGVAGHSIGEGLGGAYVGRQIGKAIGERFARTPEAPPPIPETPTSAPTSTPTAPLPSGVSRGTPLRPPMAAKIRQAGEVFDENSAFVGDKPVENSPPTAPAERFDPSKLPPDPVKQTEWFQKALKEMRERRAGRPAEAKPAEAAPSKPEAPAAYADQETTGLQGPAAFHRAKIAADIGERFIKAGLTHEQLPSLTEAPKFWELAGKLHLDKYMPSETTVEAIRDYVKAKQGVKTPSMKLKPDVELKLPEILQKNPKAAKLAISLRDLMDEAKGVE